MAKIRNSDPKNPSGGFVRLFDDPELGALMSCIQSTVISNGSELERLITDRARMVTDLTAMLERPGDFAPGTYLASKKQIKRSPLCHITLVDASNNRVKLPEPDFLLLRIGQSNHCVVLELKDGHVFDTKKSQAEHDNLVTYAQQLGAQIAYITRYAICCFNQEDPEEIRRGLKNVFRPKEILTGPHFCKLLNIDYEEILQEREVDAEDNRRYFFGQLMQIPSFQSYVADILLTRARRAGRSEKFQRHLTELF